MSIENIDLSEKNVLITGGLGFIGSNLAVKCVELGANVTIYDSLEPWSGGNLYNVNVIKKSVKIISSDIRSYENLSSAIINQDIIFDCAAHTSHPYSMKDPLMDIEVNCNGTINLLEAVRRYNLSARVIYLGTSTQVGKMQYEPIDEKHPEFPIDIYSANKCTAENYHLIYCNAHNISSTVIRLPNIYGPRSSIKSNDFGFVNYFIGLALQDMDLTIFGKGDQKRNFLFVDDCVNALIEASQEDKCIGEVFFASSDKHFSIAETAELIIKVFGKGKIKHVKWPRERKTIEIGNVIISNEKIKNVLKWCPSFEITDGLKITKDYYSNKLDKYLE